MDSRRKKARSPKGHKAGRGTPCAPPTGNRRVRAQRNDAHGGPSGLAPRPTTLRREFRAWRDSLPTALERDTLLMPGAIAESVVTEARRYLNTELPADFAERLVAKAHRLYPRHAHYRKMLNRPGNRGRDNLYMFMRHGTCGWLKRERFALHKHLPWEYAGQDTAGIASRAPQNYPVAKKLVTEDCLRPIPV